MTSEKTVGLYCPRAWRGLGRITAGAAVLSWLAMAPGAPAQTPAIIRTMPGVAAEGAPAGVAPDPVAAAALLKLLGPLSRDLLAAYSLERRADASLIYSRIPITAKFSDGVSFSLNEGRQSADFTGDHAVMSFEHLRLGPAYTLAAWVLFPMAGKIGTVWHGDDEAILEITDDSFTIWRDVRYEICSVPKGVTGWHHIAQVCDGSRFIMYFDGARIGSLAFPVDSKLRSVGNHPRALDDCEMRAMDDLLIFTRDLTKEEIAQLRSMHIPPGAPPKPLEPGARTKIVFGGVPGSTVKGEQPGTWLSEDIGSPDIPGQAFANRGTLTISSAGKDVWGAADEFHYVYRALEGDGAIVAHVATQQNTESYAKAGIMIRETTEAGARYALMEITPDGGSALQTRVAPNEETSSHYVSGYTAPYWLKLVRHGTTFTGYLSGDGVNWTEEGSAEVSMAPTATIGLMVSSHHPGMLNTSTFDHVAILGALSEPTPTLVKATVPPRPPTPATPPVEPTAPSAPAEPAAMIAAPPFTSAGLQLKAGTAPAAARDSVVPINGPRGLVGTGFIANLSGTNYLLTNVPAAATVHGTTLTTVALTELKAGDAAVAAGHDIFRIQVAAGGKPLEVMAQVETGAAIGDDILVLATAAGTGAINPIAGKILGFGPTFAEVDAPFEASAGGSPIIHVKSGKVLGVAAAAPIRDYPAEAKQASGPAPVRRLAVRLDTVKAWQPVNWVFFFAQSEEMQHIDQLTDALEAFYLDLARNRHATPGLHTNPILKSHIEAWSAANSLRPTPQAALAIDQALSAFLKTAAQGDLKSERRRATFDYFQRDLAEQEHARNELTGLIDKAMIDLRKAP